MDTQNNNHQSTNPLLQPIQMPGETFTLPSGGLLYNPGVLDGSVQNGEVRVFPMTAIDDITIKSPDMLFSGDAVRQVFARCVPQVANVDEMFARDVDFLLICLRKVSYSNTMSIEYTHNCDEKSHEYQLDMDFFIQNTIRMDPTAASTMFDLVLDNKQKVTMRPIRFIDFIKLMQINDTDPADIEKIKQMTLETVQGVIASVDGITDEKLIYEWLSQVRPAVLTQINDNIDQTIKWGPDFTVEKPCKNCGETLLLTAPLNPLAFFT